jgi:hypothetical protein
MSMMRGGAKEWAMKDRTLTDFEALRATSMSNEIGREMWVQFKVEHLA